MEAAGACLKRLSPGGRFPSAVALEQETAAIAAELGSLFHLDGLADAILAPSGTDATLLAMALLSVEQPGVPLVSIMAASSETGSGVPLAAAGRYFSERAGGAVGDVLPGYPAGSSSVAIPLRCADGAVRPSADIAADFAAAAYVVKGRPVIHLIDGSKTGITAPSTVPDGLDVIVDACQGRLSLAALHAYLRRGWPVLMTGSKFYGGPAFSGAVLFPSRRLAAIDRDALPRGLANYSAGGTKLQAAANLGMILR